MNWPRLSVVVPNYNHGGFLPNCLNALLQQSVPPLEIIVIDDASTDNSVEVVRALAASHPIIKLYRNEKNQGVVFNMNRGLQLASGDYVFLAAADDEVRPGLFEKSLALLAKYPRAALSCTISEWREGGLRWHMGAAMSETPTFLSPNEMVRLGKRGKLLIVSHSSIFRKEALQAAGGFIPELRWHCDWFATYVTGFRKGICYVPEVLSLVNIQPRSYYKSGHRKAQHREVLRHLVGLLTSSQYADVAPFVRDSGALALFAMPMFRLLLTHRDYRYFLTARFICKVLRRAIELQAKRFLPRWMARLALAAAYRARSK